MPDRKVKAISKRIEKLEEKIARLEGTLKTAPKKVKRKHNGKPKSKKH